MIPTPTGGGRRDVSIAGKRRYGRALSLGARSFMNSIPTAGIIPAAIRWNIPMDVG
ncbi:MAG: hypothetical protein WD492_13820 [Alkalispirochaeta sp.]